LRSWLDHFDEVAFAQGRKKLIDLFLECRWDALKLRPQLGEKLSEAGRALEKAPDQDSSLVDAVISARIEPQKDSASASPKVSIGNARTPLEHCVSLDRHGLLE
jgi:hypothetical protein